MDLISILRGNNQELSPALNSTNKDQTPESTSTDQVQLHPIAGGVNSNYVDAVKDASTTKSSDNDVTNIIGDSSKYEDPVQSGKSQHGKGLKQYANQVKSMIKGETKNLGSSLLEYGKNLGMNTLIGGAKSAAAELSNYALGTSFSSQFQYQSKKPILSYDKTYSKVLTQSGIQQFQNDMKKKELEAQNAGIKGTLNTLKSKVESVPLLGRAVTSGVSSVYHYALDRANSIASKLIGSETSTLFDYSKKEMDVNADWRIVEGESKWKKVEFGELIESQNAMKHFRGYVDLMDFSARVDRFYDFEIKVPANLKNLPQPLSQPYSYLKTKHHQKTGPGGKLVTDDTIDYLETGYSEEEKGQAFRTSMPLDLQANINSVDTIRLQSGETFDLGYFGAVALTKRLDMIASITTTFIEDNEYSVRKWLEAYKNYMFNVEGNSLNSINPYLHRPIYEGYYQLIFTTFTPDGQMILYTRTFLGVPNYDLSITPNPSDVKMFQVNWDIIGEEEILMGSGESLKTKSLGGA